MKKIFTLLYAAALAGGVYAQTKFEVTKNADFTVGSSISSKSNSPKSVQHNKTSSQSSIRTNNATKTRESEFVILIANKVGKYPCEVGLTDNKEFSKRFSSLIGRKQYYLISL